MPTHANSVRNVNSSIPHALSVTRALACKACTKNKSYAYHTEGKPAHCVRHKDTARKDEKALMTSEVEFVVDSGATSHTSSTKISRLKITPIPFHALPEMIDELNEIFLKRSSKTKLLLLKK
jgi:hypothetical protein